MKTKSILLFAGLLTVMLSSMIIMSCDDDHYAVDPSVSATGTLWATLEKNPELSEFADILANVYFSTSEEKSTDQTYADLLNHDQSFTLWAPKNGTFDYEKWKGMLESGERDQIYTVETELVCNCMTRYNHVLNGDKVEEILLFNNKTAIFDCKNRVFNGLAIEESNIATRNGVIHITNGMAQYLPNIYEFIGQNKELSRLYTFLKTYEEDIFDEWASTQGPTIDGEITWVDSVTYQTNRYFNPNYMNAYINREDSNYVMILPTNACWDREYEKMKTYFNYLPSYTQTVINVADDGSTSSETNITSFTKEELDSIMNFRASDAIARNLCFNANWQFGHTPEEMRTEGACDSIMSTSGYVFLDPSSVNLFDGQSPVMLSNGQGFLVDNFRYDLKDTWLKERIIEAERVDESYTYCTVENSRIHIANPWAYVPDKYKTDAEGNPIELPDTMIDLTTLKINPTRATSNPSVVLKVRNTLSCKYDIIAVMAYNTEANLPCQFRAYLNYHETGAKQTHTQLKPIENVNGTGNYFQTKTPYVDQKGMLQFNDSVLIARDFQLPISYYGLDDAYLTIEIQAYRTSQQRSLFTNEMIIDKIILIPKEND